LYLLGKGISVTVDFLVGQHPHDGPQVPGQGLVGHVHDLLGSLVEEPLSGGVDGYLIAADLDLGHTVHGDHHPLPGRHVAGNHVNGHDLQRKGIYPLDDRPDEGAPAGDHAHTGPPRTASPPRDDQHLVGANFFVATGVHESQHQQHEEQPKNSDDDNASNETCHFYLLVFLIML